MTIRTASTLGIGLVLTASLAATGGIVSADPVAQGVPLEQTEPSGPIGEGEAVSAALDHLSSGAGNSVPVSTSDPLGTGVVSELTARGATVDELDVSSVVPNEHNGTTNVYVQQQLGGIDIRGAIVNVAVGSNGEVLYAPGELLSGADQLADDIGAAPDVSVSEAAEHAAAALGLTPTSAFEVLNAAGDAQQNHELTDGGISRETIPVRLVWEQIDAKTLRLAWELLIDSTATADWWRIRIDAETGAELSRHNLVVHDSFDGESDAGDGAAHGHAPTPVEAGAAGAGSSEFAGGVDLQNLVNDGSSYSVYPQPAESPNHGTRSVVSNPADDQASPFGWHDTNGVVGPESTLTTGNNVDAGTDLNSDNITDPGSRPNGGSSLDFNAPLNLGGEPSSYRPAAVTSLFYWNNIAHDFLYAYGFDEKSGNFQTHNYGKGGLGGDAVVADAQDAYDKPVAGTTRNNANFATPPDGRAPRMQMYVFTSTTPERDSDIDAGVVVHEYAHGLSTRLTGGPGYDECLANDEQMGEGWSDIIALLATMQGTGPTDRTRGIGTYVTGEPATGNGIRGLPYSESIVTNTWSHDTIKTSGTSPHKLGAVWAEMLWEVIWALIDKHGFDSDLARGSGGNNIAAQLIIDGMKLQPCSPGFIDARDAILQADSITNAGENTCVIWTAFAKRGLGWSATQGSTDDRTDGTESFGLPPSCALLAIDAPATAGPDSEIEYKLTARNDEVVPLTNVMISNPIPTGTTYVAGSATCGGSLAGGTLTMTVGSLAVGATKLCTFKVRTDPTPFGQRVLDESFIPALGEFVARHDTSSSSPNDWYPLAVNSGEGFANADAAAVVTDQYLELGRPVPAVATTEMYFTHVYNLEDGFDGGVIEASTNGGATWTDLGPMITEGGYDDTIGTSFQSPIGGRMAFTGTKGYHDTKVDLSSFAGSDVRVRFRLATDNDIAASGFWAIDDVRITDKEVSVYEAATISSTEAASYLGLARTRIEKLAPPAVFDSVIPARLLDSRPTGVTIDGIGEGPGKVAAGSTTTVQIAGRGGVPADAMGAILNVTAIQPEALGFVTVFPCTPTPPNSSSLNFGAGDNLGNEIIAALSPTGTVCVYSSVKANLAVDVVGNLPAASPYGTVPPARLLDTRPNGKTIDDQFVKGGKVAAGGQIELTVAGRAGVPANAAAVIVNITSIQPDGVGFITAHPCVSPRPLSSSLNYTPGTNRGNEVIAELSASGKLCLYSSVGTHLSADVVGYLPAGAPVSAVTPARLLDTRANGVTIDGVSKGGGPRAAGTVTTLRVAGRAGVPGDATSALINITAVRPADVGFITVYPCSDQPTASSLNYRAGVNGGNDLVAGLSATGDICIYNSVQTEITVDVTGYTS